MSSSRVVFLSASTFGLRCLERVGPVAGVATLPPTFSISYRPEGVRNVLHAPIQAWCEESGVPCLVLDSNAGLAARLAPWRPDLIVVAGWYHKVAREVLDLAPCVGLHASLLPDYSGGAPLVWALINDEPRTGITLFHLEEGIDSGPIVGQRVVPIEEADTIATLYARVEEAGLGLLEEYLPALLAGTAPRRPQTGPRRVMPQRSPADGRLDWRWEARRIYNFIRAQTRPYPGAFAPEDGRTLRCWSSRLTDQSSSAAPGTRDGLQFVCGDGLMLEVLDHEWEEGEAGCAG